MHPLSSGSAAAGGAGLVLIFLLILAYFIPLIVAQIRHVPNFGSVAVVNVFLGWTFIGWVVALAMACRSNAQTTVVNVGNYPMQQPAQPAIAPPNLPAGWYRDPQGQERWWDGHAWTPHVR